MKRFWLLALMILPLFLMACTSGSDADFNDSDPGYDTPPQEPDRDNDGAPPMGGDPIDRDFQPLVSDRKIIYRANIGIVATDMHSIYTMITSQLHDYQAYIEGEEIRQDRIYVTLRVKSDSLDDLLNLIRQGGEVMHYQKTSEDVTNQYSTFEARLNALNAQHERIIELIGTAETMSDLLELENRRTQIETELNQIGLQLAQYDSLIDYSTVQLTLTEIDDLSLLLPPSDRPGVSIVENTPHALNLRITNFNDDPSNITVKVFKDGVQIDQSTVLIQANSFQFVTLENLTSDTSYYLEVRGLQENKSVSTPSTIHVTTDRTFALQITHVFFVSISALLSFFRFLGLTVVAVVPFIIVFTVLGYPVYLAYKKFIRPKRIANKVAVERQIQEAQKARQKSPN